jgi:RecA-family ATPase
MNKKQALIARVRENAPERLRELPVWLLHDDRKTPIYCNGSNRNGDLDSPEDRVRLVSFEDAALALLRVHRASGLGVALGEVPGEESKLCGIDLDHCFHGGDLAEPAIEVMCAAGSYTERSLSGDGLHVLGWGDIGNVRTPGIELYDSRRYFTVTGDKVNGVEALADITDAAAFARKLYGVNGKSGAGAGASASASPPDPDNPIITAVKTAGLYLRDGGNGKHLVRCPWEARHSPNGSGERSTSSSEAAYFAPGAILQGQRLDHGHFKCQHAHCADRRLRHLREFLGLEDRSTQSDEPETPERAPIDWLAWRGRTPPLREWWIQDWLGPSPTLCSGTGGIGKSLLWQAIATSLATGREFLGPIARELRVLAWMCEDDENEIVRRQASICGHFEIGLDDLHGKLYVEPRLGYDNTLLDLCFGKPTFTPAFLKLRERVNDLAIDVLVLDNVGQTFGGNESDRHQVTVFVNGIHGIVRGRPFAPVLLGHVARTQGSEFSGSAAWENACRMRWYMGTSLPDQKPDEDDPPNTDTVYLCKRKANYSEKDYRRLTYRHGLLVPEEYAGQRFDASYRNDLAERIVMKAMTKLTEVGIQPSDGKTSGDYLPTQIVAKGFSEGHSKKELASAMHRLMAVGRLKRVEVGFYSNRNPRYRLVVT